jgi:hypothetical protein
MVACAYPYGQYAAKIHDRPDFDLSEAGANDVAIVKRHCTFSFFRDEGQRGVAVKFTQKPKNDCPVFSWFSIDLLSMGQPAAPMERLLYTLPRLGFERRLCQKVG